VTKPVDPLEEWLTQPGGLADRLRAARLRAGLTGKQLAAAHGWQQPKVSKIENGRQMPTPADVEAWLTTCGADAAEIGDMLSHLDQLSAQHRDWRRRLRQGQVAVQADYNDLVRNGAVFREFTLEVVSGLLQTAGYAKVAIEQGVLLHDTSPHEIDDAVATRMRRQQYLYDQSKRFEFILGEPALRWLVCPPSVMLGQLDRLLGAVSGMPNIRFGILPLGVQLSLIPQNSFVLVDDVAYVETFVGETEHRGEETAAYHRVMDRLWADAVTGEHARRLILSAVQDVQRIAAEFSSDAG